MIYVVSAGETLAQVAAQTGTDAALIAENNGLLPDESLVPGQALVVLYPAEVYTAQEGDSLYAIAARFDTTVIQLYRNNPGLNGSAVIQPGRELVIRYEAPPAQALEVNAYAYTFISETLLRQTLPFLTFLTPFTYGFTPNGTLIPLNDATQLRYAAEYGVAPLMHLSTLTEEGNFSSELALALLSDPVAQAALIEAVAANVQEKGYRGVDVDFEFIGAQGAAAYAAFIADLRRRLLPLDCPVIVALAPKVSADQPGLLYEGHDYAALGAAANAVFLMTYEWGYTYGPPMAVAPLPSVQRVLRYAVSEIPPEKIYMGVPTYGYDWPLPYEQGVTRARSLSHVQAIDLARRYGVAIQYDETAQAPYFYYTNENGEDHEVWFEDPRSIQAKLALTADYGFRGIGYWNLDRPFPSNWTQLNSQRRIVTG